MMLAAISANIIGVITAPLSDAERPITPWMKSGMNSIEPNIPSDISMAAADADHTTRLRNSDGGRIACGVRAWTSRNTAVITRPPLTSDSTSNERPRIVASAPGQRQQQRHDPEHQRRRAEPVDAPFDVRIRDDVRKGEEAAARTPATPIGRFT